MIFSSVPFFSFIPTSSFWPWWTELILFKLVVIILFGFFLPGIREYNLLTPQIQRVLLPYFCIAVMAILLVNTVFLAPSRLQDSWAEALSFFILSIIVVTGCQALGLSYKTWRHARLNPQAKGVASNEPTSLSDLHNLTKQINAHFLFNALNTLSLEVLENRTRAALSLGHLRRYLNFSLQSLPRKIPLGEEIDIMVDILHLHKIRLEKNISYELRIDPTTRHCQIPVPLLQPLVENAIKYGMQTSPLPLQIWIRTELQRHHLHIFVTNTGTWIKNRNLTGHVGLANLRKRLELLYPGQHRIRIKAHSHSVEIHVRLPHKPRRFD
ncbi:MAG: sensor histidine kinase [Puniceicoccales bacterium]